MRTTLALIALAALTGCRVHYEDPVQPTNAVIAIAVAPDPLRLLVTCPPGNTNCFGSLDATVTVQETGGLGGRVEFVDVILYNVVEARNESHVRLGTDYLRANAGTDRIEGNGRLALRAVVEGYPFPVGQRPQIEFVIGVRFLDDMAHVVEQVRRVPLN
jgi:hypothetical protein